MSTKIKTVVTVETDSEFLEKTGTKLTFGAEEWYYNPYWFKKLPNGTLEMVSFEYLPLYVVEQLKHIRNAENDPA